MGIRVIKNDGFAGYLIHLLAGKLFQTIGANDNQSSRDVMNFGRNCAFEFLKAIYSVRS